MNESFQRHQNETGPEDPEKRLFLRRAIAAAGAAVLLRPLEIADGENENTTRAIESTEKTNGSEKFSMLTSGYKLQWDMPRDSIVLIDPTGAPIDDPIPFQDFEIEKDEKPYLLQALGSDGNITKEWITHIKERVGSMFDDVSADSLTQLNVVPDFLAAEAQTDEPELVAGIQSERIKSTHDIVNYFGNKSVIGAEDYTRINYVQEKIEFKHPGISPAMEAELRQLLPALCGKESKFNDDLESSVGASGIAQFMPSTVAGFGDQYQQYVIYETTQNQAGEDIQTPTGLNMIPLTVQIEMMGLHIDNIYRELHEGTDGVGEILQSNIVPLFPNLAAYERDFLVPCMINAYNPGAGRLRTAIRELIEVIGADELKTQFPGNAGKDVFFMLTKIARESETGNLKEYKDSSATYVPTIYALRELMFPPASKSS